MLRKLIKNKKAQNTAEYALLISLVVAGIIAMQTYAQRALQAKVRSAAVYMTGQLNQQGFDNELQYDPYYALSNYESGRDSSSTIAIDNSTSSIAENSKTTKFKSGTKETTYDSCLGMLVNHI